MAGFIFQCFKKNEKEILSPILDTEKVPSKYELNLEKNERNERRERENKREGGKILLSEMACHLRTPDPEHLKGLKQGIWGRWRVGGERQSRNG